MKRTGLVSVGALLGAATLLLVVTLGAASEGAQARNGTGGDPQVIGLDMIPDANNTATTLGNIGTCVRVTHPTTFDVDVFLDDVPTSKDLSGFNYFLNYDDTYLNITICRNADLYLLGSTAGSNVINTGDMCPDADGSLFVVTSDIGGAGAAEPAGALGVLERYTMTTQQGGPKTVGLTLTDIAMADNTATNWWATDGDQVWDANYAYQYGLIAIDEPCPPVGGIAKYPAIGASPLETADSPGGSAPLLYAVLAAAAAVALVAGGWYARRRLS